MAAELRQDPPATKQDAITRVAEQLGLFPETLRIGSGRPRSSTVRPGTTSAEAQRSAKLEQEEVL